MATECGDDQDESRRRWWWYHRVEATVTGRYDFADANLNGLVNVQPVSFHDWLARNWGPAYDGNSDAMVPIVGIPGATGGGPSGGAGGAGGGQGFLVPHVAMTLQSNVPMTFA